MLKGQAYGINVYKHLEKVTGTKVTIGVIYFALDRLTKRGFLQSYKGEPTAVRGGMRKKYYKITKSGLSELIKSKKVNDQIWKDFSELAAEKI